MGLEIERKYLLGTIDIIDTLKLEGLQMDEKSLIQVYTQIGKDHEIRLRKMGKRYIRTTKRGKGLVREEEEEDVDSRIFKLAKNSCVGVPIEKTRYLFKLRNYPCCIDYYKGELSGLVTLEVEFPSVELANDFELPYFIEDAVILDVTEDERYKNRNLALFGNPTLGSQNSVDDIINRLSKIEDGISLELELPGGITSVEAMKVIFFQLMQKILFYKDSFLETGDNEDLHQFRVNIRKTRSLLQCISDVFEENITQKFINDFKIIASSTNNKRDLDVFGEYLATLDDLEVTSLIGQIRIRRQEEDKIISSMMQGEMFENLMHSWEIVLRDVDGFFEGVSANSSIKKNVAYALILRLEKMQKKLSKLQEHVHVEKFHSVRIEFKRLRYMLEYFASYYHSDIFDETMRVSKKMQTLFGELQDRDVQHEILESLETLDEWCENVEIISSIEGLKEDIRNDIYQLRTKILMKKSKLIDYITKCIEALEMYTV